MTNGFGAGFLTLGLLEGLWGLAALLGLLGIGVSLARRWQGRFSSLIGPDGAVLLPAVVAIAGSNMLALAQGGPYLFTPVVFLGTNVMVTRPVDLPPAEADALGVGWHA